MDSKLLKVEAIENMDNEAVARIVEDAGFDPYEKKLLSITTMNSLLRKKEV
jgi:hypothetical protein